MTIKTNTKGGKGLRRSPCPVANALDVIGDKWTLLIVRDMRHGKRTYAEFATSREGIPTNILADRLRRLEEAGIIERKPYQDRPVRYAYTLTGKGEDLGEVIKAFVQWGKKHIPGTMTLAEATALRASTAKAKGSREARD
jgi:DNA-binding HxlR family transcriptional regulator